MWRRLRSKLGLWVTIITPQGRVMGDFNVDRDGVEYLENHLEQPEIVQALAQGVGQTQRYSTTLNINQLYLAGLLGSPQDPRLVIRVALPLSEVEKTLASTRNLLLGAMLMGVWCSRRWWPISLPRASHWPNAPWSSSWPWI